MNEVMDTETTGQSSRYKAGQSHPSSPAQKTGSFSLGATRPGLGTHCALQSLCSGAGGMQEDASCGRKCVGVPGCCRSCSQCSPHSWCTGDEFGWSPFRPYPSLAALETLRMIFVAYAMTWQSVSMLSNSQLGRCTSVLSALVTAWKSHSPVPLPFFLLKFKKKNCSLPHTG